jgi:peptidoglycan/LPS O-acetylase OafA/YrhL
VAGIIDSKPDPGLIPAASGAADFVTYDLARQKSAADPVKKPNVSSAGESSHELKALHGLRFFAAFCIVFSHACSWLGTFRNNHTLYWFGEFFTTYGMPLFFVLSGFVIHYNYSQLFSTMRTRWAIVEFLGARFARIYPLFICFFLVGIAVDNMLLWMDHNKLNLFVVLGHSLTLTQSWVYIVIFGDRLVLDNGYGLSWSLSTEFFFYLSYLLLVFYIARLRSVTSVVIAASVTSIFAFGAISFGIRSYPEKFTAFTGPYLHDLGDANHSVFRWFFYYSPYVRVLEFVLGCLAAQIYVLLKKHPVSPNEARLGRYLLVASLLALIACALIYVFEPFGPIVMKYVNILKLNYLCAIPIATLLFCVSRYQSSPVAAFLGTPLMVVFGDLSYSMYTVHTWTLRIFERPEVDSSVGLELEAVLRIVLAIALTMILSTATYRLIEVPARAWVRNSVARHMLRRFGSREANVLTTGPTYSGYGAIGLVMSFVAMVVLILVYQFLIVPYFNPYTR